MNAHTEKAKAHAENATVGDPKDLAIMHALLSIAESLDCIATGMGWDATGTVTVHVGNERY